MEGLVGPVYRPVTGCPVGSGGVGSPGLGRGEGCIRGTPEREASGDGRRGARGQLWGPGGAIGLCRGSPEEGVGSGTGRNGRVSSVHLTSDMPLRCPRRASGKGWMWIHKLGSPWRQAQARAAPGTETARVERREDIPRSPRVGRWDRGVGGRGRRRPGSGDGRPLCEGHMMTCGSGDPSGASGKGGGVTLTRGPSRGPEHVDGGVHPGRPRLGAVGGYGAPSGQHSPRGGQSPVWAWDPPSP